MINFKAKLQFFMNFLFFLFAAELSLILSYLHIPFSSVSFIVGSLNSCFCSLFLILLTVLPCSPISLLSPLCHTTLVFVSSFLNIFFASALSTLHCCFCILLILISQMLLIIPSSFSSSFSV